jgi:hypothetical protein
VVISHPIEGPRERPTVALLNADGSLGERVDLRKKAGIQILEVLSPLTSGVDLTQG